MDYNAVKFSPWGDLLVKRYKAQHIPKNYLAG